VPFVLQCAVRSLLPRNRLPSAFRTGVLSAAFLGLHSISCGIGDGKSTACSLSPLSLCLQLLTALAFAHTCCSISSSVTEVVSTLMLFRSYDSRIDISRVCIFRIFFYLTFSAAFVRICFDGSSRLLLFIREIFVRNRMKCPRIQTF
jgi:hypothetical protein